MSRSKSTYVDEVCQTDEDLIYNYAWAKFYHYFQQTAAATATATATTSNNTAADETGPLDSKAIEEIAQKSLDTSGLLYDSKTGLYFDIQHALFYHPEIKLYIDIENQNYYKYMLDKRINTYHMRYCSKISRNRCKMLKKLIREFESGLDIGTGAAKTVSESTKTTADDRDSSTTSDSNSDSTSSDSDHERRKKNHSDSEKSDLSDHVDLVTKYPPCIRAILTRLDEEDETIKLGSLFLIPYTGAKLGRSNKCFISFPNLKNIDDEHLSFEYDLKKKSYLIKDLKSKTGTFLNDVKIEPTEEGLDIKHGDVLRVGDSFSLLLHIHLGSNTCIGCEPGEVMSKLKFQNDQQKGEIQSKSKEEARKETNRLIKKKYGIKFNDFDKSTGDETASYKNRAKERRNEFGLDLTHLHSAQANVRGATVDNQIGQENVGRKMLAKMGWKEGKGLGKKEEGIIEPIKTQLKLDGSGLGMTSGAQCSLDSSEREKIKIVNWNKTKERFKASTVGSVFNVDDDEDESNQNEPI